MQCTNELIFASPYTWMYSPRMNIGDRLDKAMAHAKFKSQKALERASEVPQATISRILKKGGGKKGPETETIKKLAVACGVSFEWLNEGIGAGPGEAVRASSARASLIVHQEAANDKNIAVEEILDLINGYKCMTVKERGVVISSFRAAIIRAARKKSATD